MRPTGASQSGLPLLLASPAGFLFLLGAYFVLHLGLRLITSETADLDEAEQLVATQQFAWGYGAQPPLYIWLQIPLVRLFGPTILPLAILKAVLLTLLYTFTYLNARAILKAHPQAVIATLSLLFMPQIAWEAQRDLTHSTLVTLFAVLTFHVLLRLAEKKSLARYVLLGLVASGGFLTKYSFGFFLGGLVLAVLSLPSLRSLVLDRRILLSAALCALVVAPAAGWAMQNQEVAFSSMRKLSPDSAALAWGVAVGKGLWQFLVALCLHLVLLLGVYALIWRTRPRPSASDESSALTEIIWRGLWISAAMMVAGILLSGATRFLDRWLMPICVWLPILIVARFREMFDDRRRRHLCFAAGLVAMLISVAIPVRIWCAELLNWPQSLNVPFNALGAGLRQASPAPELIVAETPFLAGNLRMQFPERRIICPKIPLPELQRAGEACLVVSDLSRKDALSDQFMNFLRQRLDADALSGRVQTITAPLKFFPAKQARIGWSRSRLKVAPPSPVPEATPVSFPSN